MNTQPGLITIVKNVRAKSKNGGETEIIKNKISIKIYFASSVWQDSKELKILVKLETKKNFFFFFFFFFGEMNKAIRF